MLSARLWQFCCAIIVIFVLMKLTIEYADSPQARYKDVSSQGLQTKIENGLQQIYWQWQHQGRVDFIDYPIPSNSSDRATIKIAVNSKGLPLVEKSRKGCERFIKWFVDEKVLNNPLDLTTTVVTSTKSEGNESYFCRFEYANRVYRYHPFTGELNTTN